MKLTLTTFLRRVAIVGVSSSGQGQTQRAPFITVEKDKEPPTCQCHATQQRTSSRELHNSGLRPPRSPNKMHAVMTLCTKPDKV